MVTATLARAAPPAAEPAAPLVRFDGVDKQFAARDNTAYPVLERFDLETVQ